MTEENNIMNVPKIGHLGTKLSKTASSVRQSLRGIELFGFGRSDALKPTSIFILAA